MFINGEWVDAVDGSTFEVTNPATGEVIGSVPDGGAADAIAAIDAAHEAQQAWAATTARQRADILYRAWQLMGERHEDLSRLMTTEQGKPLKAARAEVTYASDFLRFYAEEATRVMGQWMPSARSDQRFLSMRVPVGVVALVGIARKAALPVRREQAE